MARESGSFDENCLLFLFDILPSATLLPCHQFLLQTLLDSSLVFGQQMIVP